MTLSPASTITSATFSPIRSGRTCVLLARNDGAGHLDDIGEAGFCGLEHGDGGALGGASIVGGEGGEDAKAEHARCDQEGQLGEWSRARMVIGVSFPVFGLNRYQKADSEPSAKNVTPPPG